MTLNRFVGILLPTRYDQFSRPRYTVMITVTFLLVAVLPGSVSTYIILFDPCAPSGACGPFWGRVQKFGSIPIANKYTVNGTMDYQVIFGYL